jgi:hypothetical protein
MTYDSNTTLLTSALAFDHSDLWQFEAFPYRAAPKDLPSSFVQHDAFASS